MKSLLFSRKILAATFLCCLIATLKAEGMSLESPPEDNYNNYHQPIRRMLNVHKRHFCVRCRLLYEDQLPPPRLPGGTDTIFSTEKRFVPGGPNPLHN